ncbi:MAG: family lipolytic protein [Frankiales bacterium]|nr:family lipolytic protein [Frankiales bacterium]
MPATPALRRFAAATSGLAAATGLTLLVEALIASRAHYLGPDSAPPVEGVYGPDGQPTLRLVIAGDSTAAGVGADRRNDTVGAHLAQALADRNQVQVRCVGVSGSRCADLAPQISRALLLRPDVVVILIGANDATHATPPLLAARHLGQALTRLRAAGVPTVVGTCPDMGVRGFLPPLRQLVAWQGRQIARAEATVAERHGFAAVDLAALAGPHFHRDPTLLADDAFHPSGRGYGVWAEVLLPSVRDAVATRRETHDV